MRLSELIRDLIDLERESIDIYKTLSPGEFQDKVKVIRKKAEEMQEEAIYGADQD